MLVLFSAPFLLLSISYILLDPFKIIKKYSTYSNSRVILNRDFISTETFLKKKDVYKFNSFIFGSSRTLAFKPTSWEKYLSNESRPFLFDASGETLFGIYKKIKLLDSLNVDIKNVLIVFCRDVSFPKYDNQKGHLFIKHPVLSGETKIDFHKHFFAAFFTPSFLASYYINYFSGKYYSFMKGYIENRNIIFNDTTNALSIADQELYIEQNEHRYYKENASIFYSRNSKRIMDSISRIQEIHIRMLNEIKKIFIKHKTVYKVVVSPLYEQIKLNFNDLKVLSDIFGKSVYDFSGKNTFTEKIENYYETSHYRPFVADSIFKCLYNNDRYITR